MSTNSEYFLSELLVEKQSGKKNFDSEKLLTGISWAGTPFLIAKEISESIINKLKENPPIDNTIYSSKLRLYVVEVLRQVN